MRNFQKKRLRPNERAVLDAVLRKVGPNVSETLLAQLNLVNKVQRAPGVSGEDVQFYRMRWGRAVVERGPPLDSSEETLLATVTLRKSLGEGPPLGCKVWLVQGRIFSLEFEPDLPDYDSYDEVASADIHPTWALMQQPERHHDPG